ncbi:hypothetical protein C2845_PM10G05520 [Panicum miliaceum]|uniref:Uncharacterized protein n=1 Tax=Panicum miliaceum TaxID=4540 RepID=A0A3L6PDW1_PANMI|nr:hypothetical protein C2845_PM10G05520 [Panicum miliaceum]
MKCLLACSRRRWRIWRPTTVSRIRNSAAFFSKVSWSGQVRCSSASSWEEPSVALVA